MRGLAKRDDLIEGGAMLARTLTTLAIVLGMGMITSVASLAQDQGKGAKEYVYEVRGTSTNEPNRYRSWSQFYDTEAAAQTRLKEIVREYAEGGLLEHDPDKPSGLRVVKTLKADADLSKRARHEEKSKPATPRRSRFFDINAKHWAVWIEGKREGSWVLADIKLKYDNYEKFYKRYQELRADVEKVSRGNPASVLRVNWEEIKLSPGEKKIVGAWVFRSNDGVTLYRFFSDKDGRSLLSRRSSDRGISEVEFTWSIVDGQLILLGPDPKNPHPLRFLPTVSGNTLLLKTPGEEGVLRFERDLFEESYP